MSMQKLRTAFNEQFKICEKYDGSLPVKFAQKHVLEPLCELVEYHTPSGTHLLSITQSKKVLAGEKTPYLHIMMQTPYSASHPIVQGHLRDSIGENLPAGTRNFKLEFNPITKSFVWSFDFVFTKADIDTLTAVPDATKVSSSLLPDQLPVLRTDDDGDGDAAQLEQRRKLESDSNAADMVLNRRRTRRLAHHMFVAEAPVDAASDDPNHVFAKKGLKPLKRVVVPRKSIASKRLVGSIGKSHDKTKAKSATAASDVQEESSWGGRMLKRLTYLVAGVDPKSEKSRDYVESHQYDADLFIEKN
jgi:hypothetical protein